MCIVVCPLSWSLPRCRKSGQHFQTHLNTQIRDLRGFKQKLFKETLLSKSSGGYSGWFDNYSMDDLNCEDQSRAEDVCGIGI